MNRLIGILPKQEAAEKKEPETPATADDKVDALLQHLFTGELAKGQKKNAPAPATLSINDVLPAYLK